VSTAPGARTTVSRTTGFVLIALAYAGALAIADATVRVSPFGLEATLGLASLTATLGLFVASFVSGNASTFDAYWMVAPPAACAWLFTLASPDASRPRAALVTALTAIWAARLTWNWIRSWAGPGHQDWRYVEIAKQSGRLYPLANLVGIHLFPAFLVWLGSLSLVPAIATGTAPLGLLDALAVLVTGGAIAIEALADEQLRRHRLAAHPPGTIMEEGLWAYSRHPNYFGEISFWVGLFVFGLAADPSAWRCAIGPLAMIALFVFGTIPMMEKRSLARRPQYADVQRRVSMLVPLPRRSR
jgi:steroid 5-alpha reductase family enzyme